MSLINKELGDFSVIGLPVAEELMRMFDEQFQLYLEGEITVDEMLAAAQEALLPEFSK